MTTSSTRRNLGQLSSTSFVRLAQWAFWALLLPAMLSSSGCTRAFYRQQADGEVYGILERGTQDPRWALNRYQIDVDPRSRFFDPYCPDHTPMPPDDPDSHRLMHCVDCKKGWPCWHLNGDLAGVENTSFVDSLPRDDQGLVVLNLDSAMQVGLINSRDYQLQLEELYLSALDVTFERFRFDAQFFGGNETFLTTSGRRRSGNGGRSSTELSLDNTAQMTKLFAGGGELVVGMANTLVWQYSSNNTYQANTLLDFTLVQPLLRFGGRARVLERLTVAERSLLANIRAMQRYRQEFYVQVAAGRQVGGGPSRRGGFFGGSGLEGFSGVGGGGFGRVGNNQAGGGGGGGFAGGAGAAQVGGYLGLLQDMRQIKNRRANVAALQQSLELLEAFFQANRIDRLQVDLARQALYNAQSQLLTAEAAYQTSLDNFKFVLGVPPELCLEVKDDTLDQFELLSPEMIELQNRSAEVLARLWAPPGNGANGSPTSTPAAAAGPPEPGSTLPAESLPVPADDLPVRIRRGMDEVDRLLDLLKISQFVNPAGRPAAQPAQFKAIETRLEAIRQQKVRLLRIVEQLQSFPPALLAAAPLQESTQEQLPAVQDSLKQLDENKEERVRALRKLQQRPELASGNVDRQAFDPAMFEKRARALHDFFQQIEDRLQQPTDRWQQWETQIVGKRGTVEQLLNELRGLLEPSLEPARRLERELADPNQATAPPSLMEFLQQLTQIQEDRNQAFQRVEQGLRDTELLLDEAADAVGALAEDAGDLGLVQARARLESSTLTAVDVAESAAFQIACEERLDLMNARAGLVDAWRLIEFNANALESDVDLVFSGDIDTLGNHPFRFRDTTGQLQVGLRFDAPITRLGERNTYRQSLIEYQQARRNFMAFRDQIQRALRITLRTLELNQMNFELRRAAVHVAIDQVELARLRLYEPPKPGLESTFGATTARDLVSALSDLLQVQNDYLSVWVNTEQQRMELDLGLGTMQLDPCGLWLDPGSLEIPGVDGACDAEQGSNPPVPPEGWELVPPGSSDPSDVGEIGLADDLPDSRNSRDRGAAATSERNSTLQRSPAGGRPGLWQPGMPLTPRNGGAAHPPATTSIGPRLPNPPPATPGEQQENELPLDIDLRMPDDQPPPPRQDRLTQQPAHAVSLRIRETSGGNGSSDRDSTAASPAKAATSAGALPDLPAEPAPRPDSAGLHLSGRIPAGPEPAAAGKVQSSWRPTLRPPGIPAKSDSTMR